MFGVVPQAAVAAAAGVLSRGGAAPAAAAAAERASSTAEAALVAALPERLDEFGRDANMEVGVSAPLPVPALTLACSPTPCCPSHPACTITLSGQHNILFSRNLGASVCSLTCSKTHQSIARVAEPRHMNVSIQL